MEYNKVMEWDLENSYAYQITDGTYIMFDIASPDGIRIGITQNETNPEFPYEIANGKVIKPSELRELGRVIQAIAEGYEKSLEAVEDDSPDDDSIGTIDWK